MWNFWETGRRLTKPREFLRRREQLNWGPECPRGPLGPLHHEMTLAADKEGEGDSAMTVLAPEKGDSTRGRGSLHGISETKSEPMAGPRHRHTGAGRSRLGQHGLGDRGVSHTPLASSSRLVTRPVSHLVSRLVPAGLFEECVVGRPARSLGAGVGPVRLWLARILGYFHPPGHPPPMATE